MVRFLINVFLEIILLFLLGYKAFVLKQFDTTFTLIALLVFGVLSLLIRKFKRYPKKKTGDAILVVISLSIILLGIFYFIGFFNGYNINYNSIFKRYIEPISWIKVFLIVLVSEVVRYIQIPRSDPTHKVRTAIEFILNITLFVLIDVIIYTYAYDLSKFNQLYEFISLVLFQSISKNVLLLYLGKNHGIRTNYIYRLIMDLYIYFLPVTPKLNVFIEGVVMLAYPYLVFVVLNSITTMKVKKVEFKKKKKGNKLVDAIVTVMFVILVVLVSREFKYCMIAIGSGSMTGSINKGDAVIYKTYDKKLDKLETGDVLVFYKDSRIIVHRIVNIQSVYGEKVYQTKGDANDSMDNWLVEEKDIIGVVNMRVPFIAWPSVKLNELF